MMFCVYELQNPLKDNQPFYVGKGDEERTKYHTYEFEEWDRKGRPGKFHKGRNLHKLRTIAQIRDAGLDPVVVIIQEFDEEKKALQYEIQRIASIGLGNLTNLTAGGDGVSPSEETRGKMSQAKLGKKRSVKGKARRSEIMRERWASMAEEEKEAHIKRLHVGRNKLTPEQLKARGRKIADGRERNGVRVTDEQRKAQSERMKKWWAERKQKDLGR